METTVHGGDLDYAVRRYGLKRESIKDFSGNINPLGISEKAKNAIIGNIGVVSSYPDVKYLSLRKAIASYTGASIESVIVGNGGTELISLFIRACGCKKALIAAPVYSEYEREVRINGGSCEYYALKEENSFNADIDDLCSRLTPRIGMLTICNPNNPTGAAIKRSDMEKIAGECKRKSIKLLVDETYCEFSDEAVFSSIPLVEKYDNMIVIRGISKFFAAPGLRLGYAICGDGSIDELNRLRDPWSVNALAVVAAEALFSDSEYVQKTKSLINRERERIRAELSSWAEIRFYETQANFQLFRLMRGGITSADIFNKLIQKGMMVRDAKSFKFLDASYIRFCFLSENDNNLLMSELKSIFQNM